MKKSFVCFAALLLALGSVVAACIPTNESASVAAGESIAAQVAPGCAVCHTNKAFLLENRQQFMAFEAASAEEHGEAAEGEEESEPVTAEALADGLFVDLEMMGAHGEVGCQSCHAEATAEDAATPKWHTAIVTDPTADGGQVCAECHGQEIVDNFKASLHYTMNGVAKGLCDRLGQTPNAQEIFDGVFNDPEMYMGCNTCHATCGQCHVSNPNITGGGLMNSHAFGKPAAENTCNPCHYENADYHLEVDVHATKHNLSCTDCHTDPVEFHGRPVSEMSEGKLHYKGPDSTETGPIESSMKVDVVQVTCEKCHEEKVADHPVKGVDHFAKMDCAACHSQPYANCFGCHDGEKPEYVGAWGNGDPDTLNVKLGLSIPGDPTSKLTTLNHAGMAEGSFGDGAPVIDTKNPETKTMWTAFASHFLSTNPLVSDAAKASGSMCDNCHNGNQEIFLKAEDLDLGGNDPVGEIKWAVPKGRLPKH